MTRYTSLIILVCLIPIAALTSGCQKSPAFIPQGCYNFPDGKPFMAVGADRLTLFIPGEVHSSAIGPWINENVGRFQISPGFYLRDGTATPPSGQSVMSRTLTTRRSGSLIYKRVGNLDVVSIPIEAYGYLQVVRGKACTAINR